jgi:transmembrane sensor
LGTTFAVRKYRDDARMRVVVAEGRVAVSAMDGGAPVVVSTGEGAHVGPDGRIVREHIVDMGAALAWTQGRLDFTRAPLRVVVADVARMYDLDLRVEPGPLGEQLVTGVVVRDLPASDAMAMLAGMVDGRIERRGNTFTLLER